MRRLSAEQYIDGVIAGDRALLARALTLIESRRDDDVDLSQEVLAALLPKTGAGYRVGISGVPGVGKSTFIETLGTRLVERGHRVAVLAVDPSSSLSGGSILGDKSRMARLARDDRAYIRPSPSGLTLGGVARRTREAMLVCEAAGFDVVLIETVGVGQSEVAVADMVDFFLVLMLPLAGDELQGIKKGILELADVIAVNKADGDAVAHARVAAADYSAALRYLRSHSEHWAPRATMVSGKTGDGVDELWELVERHRATLDAADALLPLRREQTRRWLWSQVDERLSAALRAHPKVAARLDEVEQAVMDGRRTATWAARELLAAFGVV